MLEKHICDYGCGKQAVYQFKSGKWCCSKSKNSCEKQKQINRESTLGKIMPPMSLDQRQYRRDLT